MGKKGTLNRKQHDDRNDLIGEHIFGDMGQLILFLIFLAVWIIDSFFLHYTTDLSNYISPFIRIPLALIVLIIAGMLARNGLNIVFGEMREEPILIRKGVFSLIRHPIYLGAILVYPGLILITFSLAATGVWMVIIAFYHFIARYEEKLLLEKFGKDYEDYMREIPMWIPRLIRNKN